MVAIPQSKNGQRNTPATGWRGSSCSRVPCVDFVVERCARVDTVEFGGRRDQIARRKRINRIFGCSENVLCPPGSVIMDACL